MKLYRVAIGIGNDRYSSKGLDIGQMTTVNFEKEGGGKKLEVVLHYNGQDEFSVCARLDTDSVLFTFQRPSRVKVNTRTGQSMQNRMRFVEGTFCSMKIA